MNCREFEDRIEMLLTGEDACAETRALARHADVCGRCRRLLMTVRGIAEPLAPVLQEQLTREIMNRTAGHACAGAEDWLCDWLERRADADSHELIALHLRHCPACSDLAEVLKELGEALPELAGIEPGPDFTAGVLQATVRAQPCHAAGRPAISALSACWSRILRRPRFVLEAAYVGTLMVFLLLGYPAIRTRAFALPHALANNGDQILHWAGNALSDRQIDAHRSLTLLEERGKNWLNTVAGLPHRTADSLHERTGNLIEEWKWILQDESPRDFR